MRKNEQAREEALQEVLAETAMSVALVRDIFARHTQAEVGVSNKERLCGYCEKIILAGRPTILVWNFQRKVRIPLCDFDCMNAHEYLEIHRCGCAELEKLPSLERKDEKMPLFYLLDGYEVRLLTAQLNDRDKTLALHSSHQMDVEQM